MVKKTLNKMWLDYKRNDTSLTWSRRLADFLLTYRSTSHSVTNQAPSELIMKRTLRNRLSLVKLNLASAVDKKQHQQVKYNDKKGDKSRELRVNQPVLVRNHRDSIETWIPGVIVKKKGPLTYLVKCGKRIRFVHIDILSSAVPPKEITEELPVIPNVLPSTDSEKTFDKRVVKDRDLPIKETPEKEELQIESEVQKTSDVSLRPKTPDVSLPARIPYVSLPEKTPERRYPSRIRRTRKIF